MPRLTSLLKTVSDMTKKTSNLPEKYIERAMEQVGWQTPKAIQYRQTVVKRKKYRFTTNRPWTHQFQQQNQPGHHHKKVFVEPVLEWTFFKGDRVQLLEGKDKGKHGLVNYVVQERNWVMVEGLNCHYRCIGRKKNYPGMMVKSEAPLLVTTQVALVDPSDDQPTQAEWRFTEEGERVRVSTRTGRIIPLPKLSEETVDYKTKSTYVEQKKDTTADDLARITFEPELKTFEMDIADKMGIKEDRFPCKTYWY